MCEIKLPVAYVLFFFVMSKNVDYIILYHHVINDGLGISDVQTNPFLSGMDISDLSGKSY